MKSARPSSVVADSTPKPATAHPASASSSATVATGTPRPRPVESQLFSAATSAIEKPITASTAAPFGRRTPSTASASVTLCATVNDVTSVTTSPRRAGEQQQRQHEGEVVPAREDVLHAEHEIAPERGAAVAGLRLALRRERPDRVAPRSARARSRASSGSRHAREVHVGRRLAQQDPTLDARRLRSTCTRSATRSGPSPPSPRRAEIGPSMAQRSPPRKRSRCSAR